MPPRTPQKCCGGRWTGLKGGGVRERWRGKGGADTPFDKLRAGSVRVEPVTCESHWLISFWNIGNQTAEGQFGPANEKGIGVSCHAFREGDPAASQCLGRCQRAHRRRGKLRRHRPHQCLYRVLD